MEKTFALTSGSTLSRGVLIGIGAACLAEAGVLARTMPLPMVSLVPVGAALLVFYVAWSTQHVRFTLLPDALRIQGDLWGRTVPRAALRLAEARVVSLDVDTEYSPALRTCGTATPGYLSGWFRLRNREKALVFVTDRRLVIYLPTTKGYSLLLSVSAPDEFLQALRN